MCKCTCVCGCAMGATLATCVPSHSCELAEACDLSDRLTATAHARPRASPNSSEHGSRGDTAFCLPYRCLEKDAVDGANFQTGMRMIDGLKSADLV